MKANEIITLKSIEFSREEMKMLASVLNQCADNMETDFDDALDRDEYSFVMKIFDMGRQYDLD
jgi:hypothetical protein